MVVFVPGTLSGPEPSYCQNDEYLITLTFFLVRTGYFCFVVSHEALSESTKWFMRLHGLFLNDISALPALTSPKVFCGSDGMFAMNLKSYRERESLARK